MGKNMLRILKFAIDYKGRGWHTYRRDRPTVDAINRLLALRLIEVNKFHQFKLFNSTNGDVL